MDKEKLKHHINLCKKNLKSRRIKCCGECPFEEEIVREYPELAKYFKEKREWIQSVGKISVKKAMEISQRILKKEIHS